MAAAAMVFVADLASPAVIDAETPTTCSTCCASGPGSWWWPRTGPGAGSRAGWRPASGPATGPGTVDPAGHPGGGRAGDRSPHPGRRPDRHGGFAPTKGDRPEWVTQKLTELGVDRIVPIATARSVVRWEGERGDRGRRAPPTGGPGGGRPEPAALVAGDLGRDRPRRAGRR